MADSDDRPLPPSYDEAMKNPSAPTAPVAEQPSYPAQPPNPNYPGGGAQPPYPGGTQPPYQGGTQPPFPGGTQPPYPNASQPSYHGASQPSYQRAGQPPYPSAGQGQYPYQNTPSGPYAYPPQPQQPAPTPYHLGPGYPAQYTHSTVTAAPTNVAVGSAGYQTTPMAYGNTAVMNQQQRNKRTMFICVCIFIMFFIVTMIIYVSVRN